LVVSQGVQVTVPTAMLQLPPMFGPAVHSHPHSERRPVTVNTVSDTGPESRDAV
jgi:hypothetical protein